MKLLAQLIVQLPKDSQNMVLNELYSQVAESDYVTRKPTLVSWLQSLSYLCAQATSESSTPKGLQKEVNMTSAHSTDSLSLTGLNARLKDIAVQILDYPPLLLMDFCSLILLCV